MATYNNFSKRKQAEQGSHIDPSIPESNIVTKPTQIKNQEEWIKQIWYFRTHLDVFIEQFFSTKDRPIKLFPFQKVILRQYGNCTYIDDVESRGLGKTFKAALGLFSLGILYPYSDILIVSKTVRQAVLCIKYIQVIAEKNDNVAREIKGQIKINKNGASVSLRSGTNLEAVAMKHDGSNLRGLRKKIIYIDESTLIKTQVVDDVLMPILELRRDVYWKFKDRGFQDYTSKLIQTTSAYLKSCDYFERLKNNLIDMKNGDVSKFVCAFPYTIGVRYGILSEDFVLSQKKKMPFASFEMEWNAKFIGSAEGSYFPYELTEVCRTLDEVELVQPKNSKSRYVLSFDVATSKSSSAANAIACLIKLHNYGNGVFKKSIVNMRSFHGYTLKELSNEIRIYCIRFPNIEKIMIDVNGLGEGLLSLLNDIYIDDENKEHPPLLEENTENTINGIRIIKGIRADNRYNNRMAVATKMYLENKTLAIPISSATLRRDAELEDSPIKMPMEKLAIYIEADALQYEMGNIVTRLTASGNVLYEVEGQTLLKDRYITLGMNLEYIFTLEERYKENKNHEDEVYFGDAYSM